MPEWLTRKVGPLPVWGYALIGVGIFFLYSRGKAASSTANTGAASNITASVPDIPTASLTTPSGFSYSGPLGGLESLIPTGALSSTNGSASGPTNPPPVASTPAPATAPSLPSVNAAAFPQIVKFGQYSPSDYTQIGSVSNGQYTGQQVSGGVPVYTNIFGGFAQGPFPQSGTYGVYIPSQFTAYEHS